MDKKEQDIIIETHEEPEEERQRIDAIQATFE